VSTLKNTTSIKVVITSSSLIKRVKMIKLAFCFVIAAAVLREVSAGKCKRQNEVYDSCPDCSPQTCASRGEIFHCPMIPANKTGPNCKPACRCKRGYLRDDYNQCIPENQCVLCRENEKYVKCPETLCVPQNCTELGYPVPCPIVGPDGRCPGSPKCVCIEGYLRNSKGVCVPQKQCRPQCGNNEVWSTCANGGCGKWNCTQIAEPDLCIDPIECKGGCVCQKGYLRSQNGNCITEEQCRSNLCPSPNREYIACPRYCDIIARSCMQQYVVVLCEPNLSEQCNTYRCLCKEGLYENYKGDCVPYNECPTCEQRDEWFVKCPEAVPYPTTCSEVGFPLNRPSEDNCPGKPGCVCRGGYVRNSEGNCTSLSECPSCGGDPNAEQGCGTNCGKLCSDLGKPKPNVCPGCSDNGCDCKDGYYYNESVRKCVRPEQCHQCGPNERYVDCVSNQCIPLSCTDLGFPVPCPYVPQQCTTGPGCICINGYLRNNKGVCVPDKQCPSCAGDPNAESGCGFRCGKHCSKNFIRPKQCTCERNGCSCKKGFIYDDNIQKCVRPGKCTPQCKENEIYATCPDTVCYPKDCSQLGFPVPCPVFKKCPSKPACVCQGGYIRNDQGECVSASVCTSCGGDENARAGCGGYCGRRCSDIGRSEPVNCLEICQLYGCDCKDGYYYDESKKRCVLPEDCPNSNTPQPQPCSDATLETLLKGSAEFTGSFLSEAYKENPTSNMIMSPISIFTPMGELASRAEDDTYTQLMKALNLQTKDDIRCAFPSLARELRGDSNVILNVAARIYTTDKYPLMRNFQDDTKNIFNAEAESINFLNREAAARRINQWVEDQTNNRIKDIAKPDMFDENTRLVLANAIYFLGNWQYQFNANNTSDRDFHVNSQTTVQIPTMSQEHSFKYAEISSLDCKALEMPYKGGNFSFFVLLPNQIDGLANLIEKIKSPYEFFGAYDSTRYARVHVFLPKIKIESEFNLKTIMRKLGITDVFDEGKSKLTNILEKYEPLYVSSAVQKSFIEVTETGTEAAAANIFTINALSASIGPPQIYTFNADRPFVYFIVHKRTVLFSGTKAN
ncbi:hypothetical protein ACJJTC_019624, partial [Scirpophaga incertulas]